jgi:RNA polymerase sigma factor (sigma-70 family)
MPNRLTSSRLYDDPRYGADLRAAHYHAHRLGLCDADCEDCAMEYLVSRLLRATESDPTDVAWRHRCASNFAKNARRSLTTRARYELPGIEPTLWDALPGSLPDPEAETMRKEFWDAVRQCAEQLRPTPRQMFLRHYADGESVQELARAYQEKPHAVEQKLHRARRRFHMLLAERGMDAVSLHAYLTPSPKA